MGRRDDRGLIATVLLAMLGHFCYI